MEAVGGRHLQVEDGDVGAVRDGEAHGVGGGRRLRDDREVVLERLALEFEPGVRYPESEVNEVLHRFHDDHVTLRRLLVDEGLLDRAAGEYWRSGGRISG
jgi:hypothetical protein